MNSIFYNIQHFLFYILSVTIILLTVSACSKDSTDIIMPEEVGEEEITFILRIPAPDVPLSRSMDNGEDYIVKQAVILAFSVEDSPSYKETLAYYREGKYISSSSENNTYSVTFRAQLKEGNYKLAIIANPGEQLKDKLSKLLDDGITDKVQILNLMQYANSGKWNAGDNYTPIPMYAETGVETIKTGTTLSVTPVLLRMLARIDVTVNLDSNSQGTFKLEKVHLANYNTNGYVAPVWNTNGITTTEISTTNLPPVPEKNTSTILEYVVSGANATTAEYKGEIYTFEAAKPESYTPAAEFYNSICLILEGSFDGETNTFYRIDLTNQSTGKYMPLLRNHKYDVIITQANRAGYKTLQEALNSYGVSSNGTLKVNTISYAMGDLNRIVFDGEYMLGTNTKEAYEFPEAGGTGKFIIYTNYADGFSLNVSDSFGQPVNWITLSMTQGTGSQTITYNVSTNNSNTTRQANIILKAGRLTDAIQITQSEH